MPSFTELAARHRTTLRRLEALRLDLAAVAHQLHCLERDLLAHGAHLDAHAQAEADEDAPHLAAPANPTPPLPGLDPEGPAR
jgi:hypothetical protein